MKLTEITSNVSGKGPSDGQRNRLLGIILVMMLFLMSILGIILTIMTKKENSSPHQDPDTPISPIVQASDPQPEPTQEPVSSDPEPTPEPTVQPTEPPSEKENPLLAMPENSLEEYQNATYKHWSETLFVTITEQATESGVPYLLTHVVIKTPSQMQLHTAGEGLNSKKQTLTAYAENTTFILGINASEAVNGYAQVQPGVYVCSRQILQDDPATGNELCIWEDGSLSSPPEGQDAKSMIDTGLVHCAISAGKILILDGTPTEGLNPTIMGTKTAISMKRPCEYYIITASDGDYISDVGYRDLQNTFLEKGCQYAKCLGDGAEVTLVMDGKLINNPAAGGMQRSLLDFLIFLD